MSCTAEMGVAPEPEPEPEPMPEPEPQPEPMPQQQEQPPCEEPRSFTIACRMTEWQKQQVIGFLKSIGVSGTIREIRDIREIRNEPAI